MKDIWLMCIRKEGRKGGKEERRKGGEEEEATSQVSFPR